MHTRYYYWNISSQKKLIYYNVMIQHDIITLISTHTVFPQITQHGYKRVYIFTRERDRHPSITQNKRFLRTIFKPWPSNRPWPTIFSPFLATVLIFSTPWVLVNVGQTRATCIFRQSANLFVPWAFVNAFVTYLLRVQWSTPWPRGYLAVTLDDGRCTRSFTRSGNGSGRGSRA